MTWTHQLPADLYSGKISGAQRLPNGNTLICSGDPGVILEVTSEGDVVWRYDLAPVPGSAGANPSPGARDDIFRAYRYPVTALP